ncbi:DUF1592 domain-containing protein [Blastopirellula sp. JC732]|uniref:DUF1592 domain-containing protein n=1 Tax=Blastopirellula sediminis TaxID=2894196 RepID=A0A9X1SFP8_9BACT|nr:DUF1592 domain-containing protein [Blastopirellula sediminis]MCC9608650.1 DUF1592 domain-containing protein [Blastopirellula sediminis]MCC9628573.1 DUF1592 domain-containing protein [Blastopirellula sediminis]
MANCWISSAVAMEPEAADHFEQKIRPVLTQYCASCHDPEDPDNHILFLKAKTAPEMQHLRSSWGSVSAQLRNRTMPPPDEEQPSEQERLEIANWIDDHLRATACELGPYAGHVTTRRLNRLEYENTIRDLVGPQLGYDESFPTDGGGGEGFNNNGETLFLPPMLMERYVEAAQEILDAAIITPPLRKEFAADRLIPTSESKGEFRPLKPGADLTAGSVIYVAGDYELTAEVRNPSDKELKLVLKLDGLPADRFTLKVKQGDQSLQTTVRLSRGFHAFGIHNPKDQSEFQLLRLKLKEVGIKRPKDAQKFHDRIFQAKEGKYEQSREAAERLLHQFAARAFRRPVTKDELAPFVALYDRASDRQDPYEERIKLALKGILVSPNFLFRMEEAPKSDKIEPIDDFELATRLSYFLWSSMPDDRLIELAKQNKLHETPVLQAEVQRMLQDPKADVFFDTFTGQWLGTKEVGGSVSPINGEYKEVYSSELAADFRAEAIQLMTYVIRENRSILEFIDGDYCFLNERLAKHYEVSGVQGSQLRKVDVTNGQRGGLLGLGGVHMVTSYPQRSSPVLRGAWVLETLLGTPVPSPPADVPPLPKKVSASNAKTFREQLEKHRDNPSCAACHDLIDPIGFGLDNYDLLGRWRDKNENGKPLDASGIMPSGEKFAGPAELKKILLDRKQEFTRQLSRKVLGYALGRSLEDPDSCTIESLVTSLEENDYRMQTLIEQIVLSTPFRNRQLTAAAVSQPSSH